ncbi:MAG: SDR family oxidoreductase [Spirochaetota bacterium]|nr:MAG: SDR family oxidoreductase [Spirochaetota bacterium]
MDLKLNNKTALVTASTGGIGQEIASYLAHEGATVIINGRTPETVSRACEDIQSRYPDVKLLQLVSDNGTAEGCKKTINEHPEIDILINNLGIYESIDFFDTTDAQWQHLFEVNILSGVRLSRHYLKKMLSRNSGRIIFISSESGISPAPEMAHYSATKLMQLSISRSMAELTKGSNVTVNSIMPGSTKTLGVEKFIKDVFPEDDYETAEKRFMKENRPNSLIARLIRTEEIAAFVAFVASPLASAINGACLRVDGGLIRSAV